MVVGVSKLVLVLGLEPVDSGSAVELCPEDLVGLAEAIELSGQIDVLSLEDGGVLLKGFFLSEEVAVGVSVLGGDHSEVLDVSSGAVERLFLLFSSDFAVANLYTYVGVAALLEVDLFSKVVVLGGNSLVITSKGSTIGGESVVMLAETGEFVLTVVKGGLLGAQVAGPDVDELLGVLDTGLSAVELEVKVLELVGLLTSFVGLALIEFLQTGDLSPQFCTLMFN